MSQVKHFLVFIVTHAIPHGAFKMEVTFCVKAVYAPQTMFPNDTVGLSLEGREEGRRGNKLTPSSFLLMYNGRRFGAKNEDPGLTPIAVDEDRLLLANARTAAKREGSTCFYMKTDN